VNQYELAAATALLGALADPDWPRLLTGAGQVVTAVLGEEPPDSLVDHVLAAGEPVLLAALARSGEAVRRRRDVPDRLAAVLEPGAAWEAILGTVFWEYRHWETILHRTAPDDLRLSLSEDRGDLGSSGRSVLVHSPRPAHCRFMLRNHRDELTAREQTYALAGILHVEGAEAVREAVEEFGPPMGAHFLTAIDEGGLDALFAELDDTATAIEAFRREGDDAYQAFYHARERARLDWALIAGAHAAEPFTEAVVTELASRGDCPEELLLAFFAAHPVEVAESCPYPPVSLFGVEVDDEGRDALFARFRDNGRAEDLVAHGRPAAAMLATAGWPDGEPSREITPVHTLVRRILAETVGLNPATWRGLRELLESHRGNVRELCEAAPGPVGDVDEFDDTEARRAYLVLLDAVAPNPEPDPANPPEFAALDSGAPLAEVIAAYPPRDLDVARAWMSIALTTGRITLADLLRHGRPPALVLAVAQLSHPVDRLPPLRELAGDLTSEAVLLALEMLGGFDGTVPELLATARAVTREGV